ncbi:beta-phosphoglucomutase [Kiritimatiella glycovorans]|uniref:Alpha,alpha-trehalose phosphorylase n=1 Tax=Kiritimatiella glycovorans TaxID=1307763 RepID=A0A0G3EAS3_9BACT|nr:beta-phosphoglucomutase [Kiritimatiella glycovorans]AKJ63358.1 Alpha,alpha-trehalose phosphorylase [Kiritimatiella glycovorans]
MAHQIRAVLFDLDGVVVFTDKYHYLGWKKLADEKGWAFDEEINHRCRGVPRLASLQVILDHNHVELPQEEKERLADVKNEYYRELLKEINEEDLYPGALDLLRRLRAEGTRTACCSSSKNAQTVLDALGIGEYFDAVVTGHDIENPKPAPDIFLLGAERVNMHPYHCLVFEDAESGVEAARAAGMKCVGVGPRERLPSAGETVEDYARIDVQALLDAGRVRSVPAEPWSLTEDEVRPDRCPYWETALALTNGVFGVRGTFEESEPGYDAYPATLVNGLCGYEPYHHIWKMPGFPEYRHAILNMCDWVNIDLEVDGERFSIASSTVRDHCRRLDLKRGIVERSFIWTTTAGTEVEVHTERLVSMVRRQIGALRYSVKAPQGTRLSLTSRTRLLVPSRVMGGEQVRVRETGEEDGIEVAVQELVTSDDAAAVAQAHSPEGERSLEGSDFVFRYTAETGATLDKIFGVWSTMDGPEDDIKPRAVEEVASARKAGYEELRREQESFWARFWRDADLEIDGPVQDQQAVRFNLFHLRQGNPERGNRSISANGLSGDQYSGHVFWDTEMYMVPAFVYTQPESVRPLLEYRYSILDKARERAREMEGKGALFSWNSVKGEECGHVFEAATAQYHLVADIACAIGLYDRMTGDDAFLFEKGAEILFEVSRFMEDRGCYVDHKGGRFCLNVVCGPDEYGCGVNNNAYTNVMTRWMFEYACEVYARMERDAPQALEALRARIGLDEEEVGRWRRAAERMYVPYDDELGITPQDDCFLELDPVDMDLVPKNTDIRSHHHPLNLWRMQVIKQADTVMLMFTQGHRFSRELKERNYRFYEPRTNHGSSLSPCMHNILACEIGDIEDAYGFFRQTALMDIHDFKNNTAGGVHSACLGGCWMTVVHGFGGMRDYPGGLEFNPVLPDAWEGLAFPVTWKGRRLKINVSRNEAGVTLLEGEPMSLKLCGEDMELTAAGDRVAKPLG